MSESVSTEAAVVMNCMFYNPGLIEMLMIFINNAFKIDI